VQLTSLKSPQCFKCLKIGETERHRELAGGRVRKTSEKEKERRCESQKQDEAWTKGNVCESELNENSHTV